VFHHHPADSGPLEVGRLGAVEQHLLHRLCAVALAAKCLPGNGQITRRQHVRQNPARQRVEHRRRARPCEAAHDSCGQYCNGSLIGVDGLSHRRPSRRVLHGVHSLPDTPRQIMKDRDERDTEHHRGG